LSSPFPESNHNGAGIIHSRESWVYLLILSLFAVLVCGFNLMNGFGEDQDSIRLLEAARKTFETDSLVPSRSWGFPMYEIPLYFLIRVFSPSLLPAKLLSLAALLGTIPLLFRIFLRTGLGKNICFLLCLIFLCNPLMIIAGNTVMETSLNVFFLMLVLNYFVARMAAHPLELKHYIVYGTLLGLANLVRPDNLFLLPSLFIFLFFRNRLNFSGVALSTAFFALVGILPYYLVGYPLFKELPMDVASYFLTGSKNVLAILGIPLSALLLIIITLLLVRVRALFARAFVWEDDVFLYMTILLGMLVVRIIAIPLELEYGILAWVAFVIFLGILIRELGTSFSKEKINRFLVAIAICSFLPNLFQISFLREVNDGYEFSPGLSTGVLVQEKRRRILNEEIYFNSEKVLMEASAPVRNQRMPYGLELYYTECDTCIVLTTKRDIKLLADKGVLKLTNDSHSRIVLATDFNISRGWRNFIQDNPIPPFTSKRLTVEYIGKSK